MASFEVRPCRREDLPAAVELLLDGGRIAPGVTPEQIRAYAEEIYFDSPWAEEDLPSLVAVDGSGLVQGFVGVIPRRMRMGDESLRAAIPGNFKVRVGADGKPNAFAALAMLKRLFAGPQALTFTDTANEQSRRLWEAGGAINPGLYSYDWFRPIKPATAYLRMLANARGGRVPMSGLIMPAAGAADLLGKPVLARLSSKRAAPHTVQPLSDLDLLELLNKPDRQHGLNGAYEPETLAWLGRALQCKAGEGRLRQGLVQDEGGRRAGAFIYVLRPDRVAQVLLHHAREPGNDLVLQALVADAAERGASMVTGQVQPKQAPAYRAQRCQLMCSQWTLVHSRRTEVLDAFHQGRARLSALDGERWTRFGDMFVI